ncbi:MAG: prenyltransferase [Spirochaetales bacterium]
MTGTRFRNFLAIVEIRTKLVSVSSFTLGTLYAWSRSDLLSWAEGNISLSRLIRTLVMFLATLCVDMGTTAWNTYFDYLRGTDDPRINREADKVLIHGNLPPSYAFWTAFWLFLAALLGGLILAGLVGFWMIPVGALCMAVGFFYNAGPLPLSHTPLGELFAGGFLGSLLFLIAYGVQVASTGILETAGVAGVAVGREIAFLGSCLLLPGVDFLAFQASLPSGLAVGAILAVNNACDVMGDREVGRKTLAVLLGPAFGAGLALILALGASVYGIVLSECGLLPHLGVYTFSGSLLFTVFKGLQMHRRGYSHSTKSRNMGSVMQIFGVYSLAYGVLLGSQVFRTVP